MSFAEEWAAAEPLPEIPAHPRCRCTIRAVYRSSSTGQVYGTSEETARAVPEDGVIAKAEAAADLYAKNLDELSAFRTVTQVTPRNAVELIRNSDPNYLANLAPEITALRGTLIEQRDYWRSLDMTEEQKNDVVRSNSHFAGFMAYRYGVHFDTEIDPKTTQLLTPELRRGYLDALEGYRAAIPRYVTDSPKFHTLMVKRVDASGTCSTSGVITMNPQHFATTEGQRNVLYHEIGHSVANRYGVPAWDGVAKRLGWGKTINGPYAYAVEAGYEPPLGNVSSLLGVTPRASTSYEWNDSARFIWEKWVGIRKKTNKWGGGKSSTLLSPDYMRGQVTHYENYIIEWGGKVADHKRELVELERQRAEVGSGIDTSDLDYEIRVRKAQIINNQDAIDAAARTIATYKQRLARAAAAAAKAVALPDSYVSDYASTNPGEDFADTMEEYLKDPARLQAVSPSRYEFIRSYIMGESPDPLGA